MRRILLSYGFMICVLVVTSQTLTELQSFRGSGTPNGSGQTAYFGQSIDIDGNICVVGSPNINAGEVYVFELNSSNEWVEVAKLTPSDGVNSDNFGAKVSIEADVIVASAPLKDATTTDEGAVYIFEKPLTGWTNGTETIKLVSPNTGVFSEFGASIDLKDDELLIGAPKEDVGAVVSAGRIYIYTKSTSSWTSASLQAELTTTNVGGGDYIGLEAKFGDGVIVSGALTGNSAGTLHVFEKPVSGNWANATTEDIILYHADRGTGTRLGSTVHADASGKFLFSVSVETSGAQRNFAHVFYKTGSNWSDQSSPNELFTDEQPDYFEYGNFYNSYPSTSIETQGSLLLLGSGRSTGPSANTNASGSVFLFRYDSLGTEFETLDEVDGFNYTSLGAFGSAIAVEGSKVLISSPSETIGGVVRYFQLTDSTSSTAQICTGSTISFGSQTISSPGTYVETFTSTDGVDSVVTLTVQGPITPMISDASVTYGAISNSGLVCSKNSSDQVSDHFLITNIQGGTLFKNDGTTQISGGSYISISEGSVGLKFKPSDASNGSFTMQASVGTDGTCLSTSVDASINVSKADLLVIPNAKSITFGESLPVLDGTVSGLVEGDIIEVSYSTTGTGESAGSFGITASVNDPNNILENYTLDSDTAELVIAKATQSITFSEIVNGVYGDQITLEATSSSGLEPNLTLVAGNGSIWDGVLTTMGTGSYSVTATLPESNNYEAAEIQTRSFTIARAPLTFSPFDIEIDQGETIPEMSFDVSGFKLNDTIEDLDTLPTINVDSDGTQAGIFDILLSGGSDDHYEYVLNTGILTVNPMILGLNDESIIQLYPNPANDLTHIVISDRNFKDLHLQDLSGSEVPIEKTKTNNGFTLNVENLENGIYLLQLTDSNGRHLIKKLIVN